MPEIPSPDSAKPLSEKHLRSLIAKYLPAWQQACDADDSDSIVLNEASFGTSAHELFLFACAIKYAAAKGKHVHVASGIGRTNHEPGTLLSSATLGSVYREKNLGSKRNTLTRRSSKRMTKAKK